MRRIIFTFLFFVLTAYANIKLSPLPISAFTLDNGLKVIVSEKHDSPAVAVHAYVKTGSIYEGKYLGCGISHYLEHLVSGGTTKNRTEVQSNALLKKIGDRVNAYTTLDHTCYHIKTTREHWETAADLISDWLANCAFVTNEVAREKGVIVQEIKMGEEEPGRVMWKLFSKTFFLKNEARVPVIGYEEDFVRVKREEIIDYYSRKYAPNNMFVVIVGDVYPDEVQKVAQKTFAKMTRGRDAQWLLTPEPKIVSPRKAVKRFNVQKARVEIGFPTIRQDDSDLFALDLLSTVLTSGESSPLVKKMKNEKQIVYSISAGSWTPSFTVGAFTFNFTCEETNVDFATKVLLSQLENIKKNPPSEKNIQRAKNQILVSHFNKLQTVGGIAGEIGGNVLAYGDPNFGVKYVEGLQKVTAADLSRVAKKYFDTNSMIFVALLPEKNSETLIKKKSSEKSCDTFNFNKHKLKNGITVVTRADDSVPLVAFSLRMPGGLVYETKNINGISSVMAGMLTKGTKSRSADDIAQIIEQLGASLSYGANRDSISGSARCLPNDVVTIIDLLADTLLNPTFPQEELDKKKRLAISAILSQKESWFREGFNNFSKIFFTNTPFAMQTVGSTGAVAALTSADLKKFHARVLQPENIVIAVAGNFNENELVKKLDEKIGGFNSTAKPLPKPKDFSPKLLDKIVKINSKRKQATVVLGLPAVDALSDEQYTFRVLKSYIGGFGGPLFRALRGEDNLVYVSFAFPFLEPETGALIMMAQCYPRNAQKVFYKMTNVAENVSVKLLTDEELQLAKNAALIPYQLDRQTIQSLAGSAATWEFRGKGANYGKLFAEKINKVTANDVQNFAKKYFKNWTCVMNISR